MGYMTPDRYLVASASLLLTFQDYARPCRKDTKTRGLHATGADLTSSQPAPRGWWRQRSHCCVDYPVSKAFTPLKRRSPHLQPAGMAWMVAAKKPLPMVS